MNRRGFFRAGALAGAVGRLGAENAPAFLRPAATAGTYKTGFAERDITPEIGMEEPGGYGKAYLKSFHDPCKARASVFDDGVKRVALVGVDALSLPRKLVLEAREAIRVQCGIPPEAVLIGASHSHSSGPVTSVQPGEYDHASPLVKRLAYELSTAADPRYIETVKRQIVAAVCAADASRSPSRDGVGSGYENKVAFNRRFRMKNDLSYTHPGQGNPDMLGYAGPTDPEVGVIGSWDTRGQLQGCVINYCCHGTTNPPGISANWIYYMESVIRGVFGPHVVVVFLQGASGDVTQVDNLSPYHHPNGPEWAKFVGGRVGAEAVKVLLTMQPDALTPVACNSNVLTLQRRAPSPERVRECTELVQQDPKAVGVTRWTFAKEIVLLDALLAKSPSVETEVQAIQVGPAVFLANSAELFCEYGLEMKAKSPFKFTFPVELANGVIGYVPTAEALGPHGGGYETRLTSYTNLEPTAGKRITDMAVALASRLKPGVTPEPPKAPPFREAWSYGNVPPELS
jgi:hypothetical protein